MQKCYELVVIGILRRGGEVAMVRQELGPGGPSIWLLPGGLVEAGELLTEALVREVREESGLTVLDPGYLAYTVQIDRPAAPNQVVAYGFEVGAWSGDLAVDDPDGEVLAAEFAPVDLAVERLARGPWSGMGEPLRAYLRGAAPAGTCWFYRQFRDEADQRAIARIAPPGQPR